MMKFSKEKALQCENGGAQVTLQLQQDAFLRLTVTGAEVSPQTFYLLRAATAPDEAP